MWKVYPDGRFVLQRAHVKYFQQSRYSTYHINILVSSLREYECSLLNDCENFNYGCSFGACKHCFEGRMWKTQYNVVGTEFLDNVDWSGSFMQVWYLRCHFQRFFWGDISRLHMIRIEAKSLRVSSENVRTVSKTSWKYRKLDEEDRRTSRQSHWVQEHLRELRERYET